jgi:hypothetical protein
MRVLYEAQGGVEHFERLAASLITDPEVEGLMVLACDANAWTPTVLNPVLKALSKPVFGGVFPQIIHNGRNEEKGTLVIGLPRCPEPICIRELSDLSTDYTALLEPWADRWAVHTDSGEDSLIVFVDGLSKRISALVESLFDCFGLERNFIGGGVGSLSFIQRPCLITPDGLIADAALVVRLPMGCGVGVAHGWQPISDSMKVTEADCNVIQSLDWQPAFEVYRQLVEAHSGRVLTPGNFFNIAKSYPFGINKMDSELVVRDPLMPDDAQGLVCVGEVPKGSFVRLLHGSPESLIAAAARARVLAEQSTPPLTGTEPVVFFIDCISRALFLGDRIVDELQTAAAGRTLFGAMTLGEIANNGKEYLEFYNKTSVLAMFRVDSQCPSRNGNFP